MNIERYPLKRGQFFPEMTTKTHIVWHGTAGRTINTPANGRPGRATTSIDGWNRDASRIGAPWLVDRGEKIYQTFEDSGWIYHLGIPGTKGRYDKSSVAIEFANEGPLVLDGDRLYAFGQITPNTRYNGKHFAADWRGSRYFAELDESQVDQGIELTLDICRRHDIEPAFYYPSGVFDFPRASRWRRSSVTRTVARTRRICCYRIGSSRRSRPPAFAWSRDLSRTTQERTHGT